MKVRVEIEQRVFYCGTIEMSEKKYKEYKNMLDMDVINSILLKEGINRVDSGWSLEVFLNLSGSSE